MPIGIKRDRIDALSNFYKAAEALNEIWLRDDEEKDDLNTYCGNYPEHWMSFDEEVRQIFDFVSTTIHNVETDNKQ